MFNKYKLKFSEMNGISKVSINNQPVKYSIQRDKFVFPFQNSVRQQIEPSNPQFWQSMIGIKEKTVSFSGNNEEDVNTPINEIEKLFYFEKTKRGKKKECLKTAENIAARAPQLLDVYYSMLKNCIKGSVVKPKMVDLTNMVFSKVNSFPEEYVTPLSDFFYNLEYSKADTYNNSKDLIGTILSDNSKEEEKLSWLSYRAASLFGKYDSVPVLTNDYFENYSAFFEFINNFSEPGNKKYVSSLPISKEQMLNISWLIKNKDLPPENMVKFAHSVYIEDAKNEGKNNDYVVNNVVNLICDDKDKLDLFNELMNMYSAEKSFNASELNIIFQYDSEFCRKLISLLKDKNDEEEKQTEKKVFINLLSILDEDNIDDFKILTEGKNAKNSYSFASRFVNPYTGKFGKELIGQTHYIRNKLNLSAEKAADIAAACIDASTGKVSPVANELIEYICPDDNSLRNLLMNATGKIFSKPKNIMKIKSEMRNNMPSLLISVLKNSKGEFKRENLKYIKKLLSAKDNNPTACLRFSYLMNLLKNDDGVVDENKFTLAYNICKKTKSFGSALMVFSGLKDVSPEKYNNIYEEVTSLKMPIGSIYENFQGLVNFCYDNDGVQKNENFEFIQKLSQKINIYGQIGPLLNMCSESKDNQNFIMELTDRKKDCSMSDAANIGSIYDTYKQGDNTLPETIKHAMLLFASSDIPFSYFIAIYEQCKNESNIIDNALFNKVIDFISIQNKCGNKESGIDIDAWHYVDIVTNNIDIDYLAFKSKVSILNAARGVNEYCQAHKITGFEHLADIINKIDKDLNSDKGFITISNKDRNNFISNVLKILPKDNEYTDFEKIIVSAVPELEKMENGIPVSYTRESFLEDLSLICNYDKSALNVIKNKLEIEPVIENNGDDIKIVGYDGLLNLDKLDKNDKTEGNIYECAYHFIHENTVNSGNKELDRQLNYIIKAFPEFINTIGKKQHATHKYTLDIHQLLVLAYSMQNSEYLKSLNAQDKSMLKLACIFHDIMKKENAIDKGHQNVSSLYARSIVQKVIKNPEQIDRLYELINNHHWLEELSNSDDRFETTRELAYKFRRPNDYDIAKIMADSDLKAVSEEFYEKYKEKLKNPMIFAIGENINFLYSTGNALFTDNIVSPKRLKTNTQTLNGKTYNVVNFNEISEDEDMGKYGFYPGIKKNDINLLVHMVDTGSLYDSLFTVKLLNTPINGGVLSESLIRPKNPKTYRNRKYGVVLSQINTNIVNEYSRNQGSGYQKEFSDIIDLIYRKSSDRIIFREKFLGLLGFNSGQISDDDYSVFYKNVLASKTSLKEISPDKKYKLGHYYVNGECIINALKKYQNSLIDENEYSHNEIIGYTPKIKAVIAKEKTLKEVPAMLLKFAYENNLPIFLI